MKIGRLWLLEQLALVQPSPGAKLAAPGRNGPCSRSVASTLAERMSTSELQRLQQSVYLCTISLAVAMLPAWPGLPRVPGGQCIARRAAARASAV